MDYTVWSILETKACSKPHRFVGSLKKAIQKVWDEIDAPYLRATADPFPKRLRACIDDNGDGGVILFDHQSTNIETITK
ncbi:hypothetical protein NECAME_14666 [Necator americanus]|uniref:Uncharacterized protein n=1 Tax=Necator americanus TaxID=51031 RepID=W2SNX2_NECAM|nr:hypothetical protein NECAME_14666 [Necator americanus]ETN70571.1 hypothetical protein NECAME_14666 [Necator americanus]